MINSISDGISRALYNEFGVNYEIYTENIEQGLKEPCFLISVLNPTSRLFLGKRYFRSNLFCIQYFPSTTEKRAECNDVLSRLFECLEQITVDGDTLRGTKLSGEFSDDVQSFFVKYDMFVYKVSDLILMEDLTQINQAKG